MTMTDYATQRFNMVEGQVRPNKVTDPTLVEAMMSVPREAFVPPPARGVAYVDADLPLGNGRYLMEPMVLARLLNEARIGRTDVVLEIGCATGYATAVLARLAARVVALEASGDLARQATENLAELGISTAVVVQGALPEGHASLSPYEVILINGAVAAVPSRLLDQLAEGGRLVTVVSPSGALGQAKLYERRGGVVSGRALFEAGTPILPGFEPRPRFEF